MSKTRKQASNLDLAIQKRIYTTNENFDKFSVEIIEFSASDYQRQDKLLLEDGLGFCRLLRMACKHILGLLIPFSLFSLSFAHASSISCSKTLLECDFFKKSDEDLNLQYKNLAKRLNKEQKALLKEIQRNWITWRDDICDEIVTQSGCTNASCENTSMSYCLVDLTNKRLSEIKGFLSNRDLNEQRDFSFSKSR